MVSVSELVADVVETRGVYVGAAVVAVAVAGVEEEAISVGLNGQGVS